MGLITGVLGTVIDARLALRDTFLAPGIMPVQVASEDRAGIFERLLFCVSGLETSMTRRVRGPLTVVVADEDIITFVFDTIGVCAKLSGLCARLWSFSLVEFCLSEEMSECLPVPGS